MNICTQDALDHVDDSALIQAVQHHRRAVASLDNYSFVTTFATSDDLIRRMKADLSKLEKELERRGLDA